MYRKTALKKLVGFDQSILITVTIVLSAISFPLIFLDFTENKSPWLLIYSLPYSLSYASIICLGNLEIFYQRNKNLNADSVGGRGAKLIKEIGLHVLYTAIASLIMAHIVVLAHPNQCKEWTYYLNNVVGSLFFTGIMLGVYEVAFAMHQLRISGQQKEVLRRKNAESQLEVLKSQVKPHFLFNSLNTLSSIIHTHPDIAVEYVQNLSHVYRYILDIREKKLIPLDQEILCVRAYLKLLKVRFGDNIVFRINDENLSSQHHIVPLALQLLVENAVKHNIISKTRPLQIDITIGSDNTISVVNNLQLKHRVEESTGTGLKNIQNRYAILTGQDIIIQRSEEEFKVVLPLIEVI